MDAPINKGPFQSEDEALAAVVERLVSGLDPQAIWLFGSRARGTARPDSDFDLLAVAKKGAAWGNDHDAAYRPLRGLGVGCDVVPCGAEDFEEAASWHTSLVAVVLEEGRKLYEARS